MHLFSGRRLPGAQSRLKFSVLLLFIMLTGLILNLSEAGNTQAAVGGGIGAGNDSPFGMNVQAAGRYMARANDDYSVPFSPTKAAGIGWDREEYSWSQVEPYANNWNWVETDGATNAATARGISILGLLGYNVNRSSGKAQVSQTMPDLAAFANYVSQVVSRYKDRVHYWQIWNEPQDDQYLAGGAANPGLYAQILATAYNTIKRVDPGAKIVAAGFVPVDNGIDWMNRLMAISGGSSFDILAVHPYVNDPTPRQPGGSMSPERAYWATTDMNQVSNFSVKIGKPVWATEMGWTTTDSEPGSRFNHVSADLQADYLTRAYVTGLSTSNIQKFFIYQFHEDNTNPNDRYGLLDTGWQPTKPAFNAYKNMTARLTGATPLGPISPYEGTANHVSLYDFDNSSGAPVSCANGNGSDSFWSCYASSPSQAQGQLSSEQHHSGNQALKISYNFQSGTNGRYVVFSPNAAGATKLNSLRNLTRLGMWVYGDGNRTIVRLTITDNTNQFLSYDMGRMGPPSNGWQRYEAQLAYPNETGHSIQYPIKNMSLLLDGQFQTEAYSGTTYVDDIYAEDTPPVYLYRFAKDGQNMDVIWADNASTGLSLPTASGQATVYNRDGQAQTVAAVNGQLNLQVSDAPIYVLHQGRTGSPDPGNGSTSGSCPSPDSNTRNLFQPTWAHYDEAITSGLAKRSWIWGPPDHAFRLTSEPYDEAPGGCRTVLYWDKSRMEITNPGGNQADKYFVTNGLLAKELVSGLQQYGNSRFVPSPLGPAQIPAAGDQGGNPNTPTYATFARVTTLRDGENWQTTRSGTIVDTIDRNGLTGTNGSLSGYNVGFTNYVGVTHHNIADIFWQFMNSQGPVKVGNAFQTGEAVDWIYSIGLPISEPYWARVTVAGQEKDVLIQVFERRVLTYTPSNSEGYKVEMGNIGGHYATWRYGRAAASLKP